MNNMTGKRKLAALLAIGLMTPALANTEAAMPTGTPGEAVLGAAVSDQALSEERGKALTNTNDLDGFVYENKAENIVTGSNFITDGSFTGNAGASTVIQNSGNNVLIQNALILNVQLQ